MTRHTRTLLIVFTLVAAAAVARVRTADFLMEGPDNGRTGWVKDEKVFNTTNVKDMKLLWKVKLDTAPREMHNLFAPLIVEHVTTTQGDKQIALVAGVSDTLFALDVADGKVLWSKKFESTYTPGGGRGSGTLCPGGQTAVPAIGPAGTPGKYTVYAVSWDGRLHQLNLADGQDVTPVEKFMPPNAKPYALNLFSGAIYTTASQGCGGIPFSFLAYDIASRKSTAFLPQGGGLWGRRGAAIDPEGRAYQGTGDGPYLPEARNLGNAIVSVKMDPATKELKLVDWFAPKNANWLYKRDLDINVSPIAFDFRGRKFLVGTSKECRLWLLDRDALGGDDHRTPLDASGLVCNDKATYDARGVWGAMAAWQQAGQQWIAVPFWGEVSQSFKPPIQNGRPEHGGVGAFRVEQVAGKWKLVPAWISRDMDMGEEVVVAGGVVFAYGSGEDTYQQLPERNWNDPPPPTPPADLPAGQSSARILGSTHATIYALDAQTGKELWSSGNQITSWNHFSGITAVNGRVYLGTYDGTMYCFGVK